LYWSIYKITQLSTDFVYIGRTQDPCKRWKVHKGLLECGRHFNVNLQRAWDSSRPNDFEFSVTQEGLTTEESVESEKSRIAEAMDSKRSFNINTGGYFGDCLTNHPDRESIIQRRSNSQREFLESTTSDQRKEIWGRPGVSNPMFGKTHTDTARRLISLAHKGNSYCLGIKKTPEHRKRLSELASQRTGCKNPFFGKKHSAESIRKMSEANMGKKPSNSRRVLIAGVHYESVTEASRQIGVTPGAIVYRLKSPRWPDHVYEDAQ